MAESTEHQGNASVGWDGETRHAARDWPVIAALLVAFSGWYLVDFVAVSLGAVHQGFRFYELPALIGEPARIVKIGHPQASSVAFGVFCFATLSTLLASLIGPAALRRRVPRLSFIAPLTLTVLCSAVLWYRASRDPYIVAEGASDIVHALASIANSLAARASTVVTRHVNVGLGAWVSLLSTLYLAYHGVRPRTRRRTR